MSELTATYWRLLRLTEDYFDDQMRSEREYAVPAFRSEALASVANTNPAACQPRSALETVTGIVEAISGCTLCGLSEQRIRTVPGEGVADPAVMGIGEGPGAAEDRTGRPFVGPAGRYLDKWLAAIQLDRRKNCFIANVVKCRPPNNRDPEPGEVGTCMPYLERQIDLLEPSVLLAVGRVAANHLIGVTRTLAEHRSGQYEHRGRPLFVTYHPSAVLRDPSLRASVWEDLKKLRAFLDRT